MLAELKELFAAWIAAVVAAVDSVATRIVPQRRVLLVEGDADSFTARITSAEKGAVLPETSFRLSRGRAEPAFSEAWQATLRGSRISILMRPDHFLFRDVDFPKAAADFLDGMIRAQIDRLAPWPAGEALFGMTPPEQIANERIALTVVATSKQQIKPLLSLAAGVGAVSVAGLIEEVHGTHTSEPVRIFEQQLTGATPSAVNLPRLLRRTLFGTLLAAAASLAIAAYVGSIFDSEQQDLQHAIAQRRAVLRTNQTGGSAETLLAKRKQTSPATVMVLEAISRVLPDSTYVTELRIEGDKVQVVGLTQDAPSLIKLMEQSPQFTRATFFAPTTRGQNDSGERFHIEAHITPYFGSPS
jgi:general secretion pathway protein L